LKSFQAEIETHGVDFTTAKISLSADMVSISSDNDQRDAHLQNSDFFEVEKYPELMFTSTKAEKIDRDTFALFGDLALKGVTRPVKLNVECNGVAKDPWGAERAGFVVSGKINRSDWGVNFNGVGNRWGSVE
jgi:polyisoprenoid-binding protein YceI